MILPFALILSQGIRDGGDLWSFVLRQAPALIFWLILLLITAQLGIHHARKRTWDSVVQRYLQMNATTLELHVERKTFLRLFLKWGRCFRCLSFWYGGFVSLICWSVALYEWYMPWTILVLVYFFIVGASLSAALSALYLLLSYTKHREDPSEDFFR